MQLNLRILWPKAKFLFPATELGRRAMELGYNALVSPTPCPGIAWIKEITSQDELKGQPDYFLWKSYWKEEGFFTRPGDEKWTRAELLAREMEQLENKLKGHSKLIFCLPGEEKIEWMSHLAKCAGPKTLLAFSPYCSDPTKDFLPPQPIWKKIVEGEDFCNTPLLPVLNTGMIGQGGGLWPTLPFDLFDRFFSHLPVAHFRGAISLTPAIPSRPGFLSCALWVGSQLIQREDPPEKRLSEWFFRFRQADYFTLAMLLRNLRTFSLEITLLNHLKVKKIGSEEARALLEGLNSKIAALHNTLVKEQPALLDHFTYFVRDARRLMSHFASQHNVSYSVHADEALESFWTKKMGSKVLVNEEPFSGNPGSKLEALFMESWG